MFAVIRIGGDNYSRVLGDDLQSLAEAKKQAARDAKGEDGASYYIVNLATHKIVAYTEVPEQMTLAWADCKV